MITMVQQLDIVVGYNGDVTANWDVPPGQSNIAIGENPQPMGIVPWLKLSEDSHKNTSSNWQRWEVQGSSTD